MNPTISSISYCPVKSVSFQNTQLCEIKKNLGFVNDRIFFLKLFNSIKKRVNIEVIKNIKKILKILNNIKIQFKLI